MGEEVSKKVPLAVQEALGNWLSENPCLGDGDIRAAVTLESLQRSEVQDSWVISGRRCSRNTIMELILDLVCEGYSLPAILEMDKGMPKPRTVANWLHEYKPFREMMDVAEQMYGRAQAHQAEAVLYSSEDPKQAFRDKAKSDLKMKLAEVSNPKRFGKKQQVEHTHTLEDLDESEITSQLRSWLVSHKAVIEQQTGLGITVPVVDAEIVDNETGEPEEEDYSFIPTLGMQGDPTPKQKRGDKLDV